MKNIYNSSIFILLAIIVLAAFFYLGDSTQLITKNILILVPAIISILSLSLFVFIFMYQKKTNKLEEEIKISNTSEFYVEDTIQQQESNDTKAENLINYSAIAEKIASRIGNSDKEESQDKYFENLLSSIAKEINGVQSVMFIIDKENGEYKNVGKYAYYSENKINNIKIGEGISGQVLKDQKILLMDNVPSDYIKVVSGLGNSTPKNILMYPLIHKNEAIGLIEVAAFEDFIKNIEIVFDKLTEKISPQIIKFINQ